MLFFPKPFCYPPNSHLDIVFRPSCQIRHGIDGEVLLLGAPEGEDEVGYAKVEGEGYGEGEEQGL